MGRPTKNTVDYFPHDSHASEGDTLTVLQNRFHNDGYAFWFKLLEKLASSENHYIDCSNPIKWQVLLAKLGVDELLGTEIMLLLAEMKAIDSELWASRVIWCQNLVNNLSEVYKRRECKIPNKPVIVYNNGVSAIINHTESELILDESAQSKVKETKVNKSEVNNTPDLSNNETLVLIDEKLAKIAKCYESNIGQLTGIISDDLKDIAGLYPDGWFEDAVKIACERNARNLSYISKILKNWSTDGRNNGHKTILVENKKTKRYVN
ncbi:DUF4373 domain-containing protein [Candidatus Dojkabacteria bacterium]|jgi:DnaD/phage-associated family protein|nr:DUF4373 domain-containing protein [Candidatus Dojkabacteria bacterium]